MPPLSSLSPASQQEIEMISSLSLHSVSSQKPVFAQAYSFNVAIHSSSFLAALEYLGIISGSFVSLSSLFFYHFSLFFLVR